VSRKEWKLLNKTVSIPSLSSLISLCVICLTTIAKAEDVEPPEWVFSEEDIEAEVANWGLTQVTVMIDEVEDPQGSKRTVLITNPIGDDPMLYPVFEPFKGEGHDILYLGVRVEKPSHWEFYYTTPRAPDLGPNRVTFDIDGSPDFQDLEIKITTPAWVAGEIDRIRLDPGDFREGRALGKVGEKIPAEITYISFRGKPEGFAPKAVCAKAKLATAWGAIKHRS
jgi:hypothetical protein